MTTNSTSRRDFLRAMGVGAASLAVCGVPVGGVEGIPPSNRGQDARDTTPHGVTTNRPNVVLILADDLGYGDLSCYGASKVQTPNIDRLAREGRRFTDAHSPASVCTPSRYNLLTGRYAWRTWAKSSCVWSNDPMLIDEGRFTLANLFKQQGYRTACMGKWHLGFGKPGMEGWDDVLGPDYNRELRPGPLDVGFDYFWGIPHAGQFPHVIIENRRVLGLSPDDPIHMIADKRPGYEKDYLHRPRLGFTAALGVEGGKAAWYTHEDLAVRLTERAVTWLHEQKADQPFFLYLAPRNIHAPLRPNERFKGKSELGVYGDFILELDWSVGEVLKALDEKGLTKDTIVLFSSDNGGVARYKPTYSASINGHKVNGPLRGQKTDAYEGGHRVPLIARWPGMISAKTEDSSLVALTDMLATFTDLFGVQLPQSAGEDSFSFLGALLGRKPEQVVREAIVNDGFSGVFAIRRGDWKLILSQHGGGAGMLNAPHDPSKPAGQLYHLGRDIGESTNEYDQHPEIVKSLSDLLEQYKQAGRSAPIDRSIAAEKRS